MVAAALYSPACKQKESWTKIVTVYLVSAARLTPETCRDAVFSCKVLQLLLCFTGAFIIGPKWDRAAAALGVGDRWRVDLFARFDSGTGAPAGGRCGDSFALTMLAVSPVRLKPFSLLAAACCDQRGNEPASCSFRGAGGSSLQAQVSGFGRMSG